LLVVDKVVIVVRVMVEMRIMEIAMVMGWPLY